MGFVQEFKDFALKGNVFDMAIGVIIGGAFGKIVTSLLDNVLMPVVGKAAGEVNFNDMFLNISGKDLPAGINTYAEAKKSGAMLGHGAFITDVINFIILAFVVFMIVKMYTTARKKFEAEKPAPVPPAPAGPTADQKLLMEIRDLLAKR
jgi:large conductance mechanosensitive channel